MKKVFILAGILSLCLTSVACSNEDHNETLSNYAELQAINKDGIGKGGDTDNNE